MKTISSSIYQAFGLVVVAFTALSLQVQAVVPPPDGGYPNFTTAEGDNALRALTSGVGNTAVGTFSLFSVSIGNFNTAVGAGSLDLNTADSNTATGAAALLFNTTGSQNTAVGAGALEANDSGDANTATGAFALSSNTTGSVNGFDDAGHFLRTSLVATNCVDYSVGWASGCDARFEAGAGKGPPIANFPLITEDPGTGRAPLSRVGRAAARPAGY